jgi:hypothetical protein
LDYALEIFPFFNVDVFEHPLLRQLNCGRQKLVNAIDDILRKTAAIFTQTAVSRSSSASWKRGRTGVSSLCTRARRR